MSPAAELLCRLLQASRFPARVLGADVGNVGAGTGHFPRLSAERFQLAHGNALARLLELAVVLDRATALEELVHTARVATLIDGAVPPRATLLLSSADAVR